jgi:hypothetical protein
MRRGSADPGAPKFGGSLNLGASYIRLNETQVSLIATRALC